MLVFIDESGDPGFKLTRGSSPVFVAAMVIFHDHEEANMVDREIEGLRTHLRHRSEFKFSKCRPEMRDTFCKTLAHYDFTIRAIVVVKERIYSPALQSEKEKFYGYFVKQMMQHDGDILDDAIVKIDGSGDRKFKKELNSYLRRMLGRRVKYIRMVDSRSNNLVQLADMAAGAIHRSFRDDRREPDRWRLQLQHRIQDIWPFPNEKSPE